MRRISIAGQSFEFAAAQLVAYHCAAGEADWNVELIEAGGLYPGRLPDLGQA